MMVGAGGTRGDSTGWAGLSRVIRRGCARAFTTVWVARGCRQVIVRVSYAPGDSRGPVVVALLAMAVNVVGDLTLAPRTGLAGLAAAAAATASLTVAA